MIEIVLDYPDLSAADWRVLAAIKKLGGDSYREDVAALASVSARQVSRCAARLEAEGLLVNKRYFDRAESKTRSARIVTLAARQGPEGVDNSVVNVDKADLQGGQRDNLVLLVQEQQDNLVTLPPVVDAVMRPNGAKGQSCPTMHVCMHDGEIEDRLSFLDVPGLKKLLALPHLTLELAEAWANHKAWKDINGGWGQIRNPAAYIYKQLEKGEYPVWQQPLPEESLDLTDQMADHPLALAGGRFVGGVWK